MRTWPCAEIQLLPVPEAPTGEHELFRQAEARPGLRIVDHPPADLLLVALRRIGKPSAFVSAE